MPKIIDDAQIYRSVMQVVIQYGYEGATTKRLAKEAGIGEVTLFRRYGSKSQLVKEAMGAAADQANFEASVQYTGNMEADLLQLITEIQHAIEEHGRFFYTLFIEAARHPELQDGLILFQKRFRVAVRLLGRYQAEGVLVSAEPMLLMAKLIGPLMIVNLFNLSALDMSVPSIDLPTHVATFIATHRAT